MNNPNPKRFQSMLWGRALDFWDSLGLKLMFVGAAIGVVALFVSLVSAYVLYRVADKSQEDFETQTNKLELDLAGQKTLTAQAVADAAKAQLALEQFKAPRQLTDKQMHDMSVQLSVFKGQRVSVGAIPVTFESSSFAGQLLKVFQDAGLSVDFNQGAAEVQVGAANGVVASATNGNAKGVALAVAISKALSDDGIKASADGGLLANLIASVKARGDSVDMNAYEWVVVVIGDKN